RCVVEGDHGVPTECGHGLDGKTHALEQDHTLATLAVVEHVRVHVHLGPDAVPPVFTNVAVTAVLGDVGPDRVADVPQALVRVHLSDPLPHGFLTGLHHAQVLLAAFPHRDGDRRVAVPPTSEEHTSELQSRFDLVCRLLLD